MRQKLFYIFILTIILLVYNTLFYSGNYVIFILTYIFSFVFLLFYSVFSISTILEKIVQSIVYALIMVSQILFDTFIVRSLSYENGKICILGKLLGALLIFTPFLIKISFFNKQHNSFPFTSWAECYSISYSQLLHDKNEIFNKINKIITNGQKLSNVNLQEIIHELPRHSSFAYINNGSLTDSYFEQATKALYDGYIYIIITKSKSASSEVIGLFTNKEYNHVSLSFDKELHTIISYNGGEKVSPPGLNHEFVEQLTKRTGASIMLYRLPATYKQKHAMLDKIREINNEGSSYNLLGLLFKVTIQPNIMFCSQFVYVMLEFVGLNYFEKDAIYVTPTDFIELDYYRNLDFVCRIDFNKQNLLNGEKPLGKKEV